jgi:riboflavin synthase
VSFLKTVDGTAMFTGLIEGTGTIETIAGAANERRVRVSAAFLGTPSRGESIAVDGVCLTAVESGEGWFEAVLSEETLRRTTLGRRAPQERVNLERSLRLSDRLGGHLVQGHVDGTGAILEVRQEGTGSRVRVGFEKALAPLIVEKGSIAVDGISLTVAARGEAWFETALIPETLRVTTIGLRSPGDEVNLEADLVGRYVLEALRARGSRTETPVTREYLARHGFGAAKVNP